MSTKFLRQTSTIAHHIEGLARELNHQTKKHISTSIGDTLSIKSFSHTTLVIDKSQYIGQLISGILRSYQALDLSFGSLIEHPAIGVFVAHFRINLYPKLQQLNQDQEGGKSTNIDDSFVKSVFRSYDLYNRIIKQKEVSKTKVVGESANKDLKNFMDTVKNKQKALRSHS